jgi:hypothetical protein
MKVEQMVAILVLAMAGSSFAAEKVTLKNNYQPGTQVLTYSLEQRRSVPGTYIGQRFSTVSVAITLEMGVEKPTDQQQTIHVTFKRFKEVVESARLNYDSADPEKKDSPIVPAFLPLLDKSIEVILGPDGKVEEVKGMDKIWEDISVDGRAANMVLDGLKQQFDKRMFSQMLNVSEYLPSQPVAPGDSWNGNDDINIPKLDLGKLPTKCVLKEINGRIATIETSGKKSGEQDGIEYEAEKKGTLQVNVDKGQVAERQFEQNMKLQSEGGRGPINMELHFKVELSFKPGKYAAPVMGSESKPETPSAQNLHIDGEANQ